MLRTEKRHHLHSRRVRQQIHGGAALRIHASVIGDKPDMLPAQGREAPRFQRVQAGLHAPSAAWCGGLSCAAMCGARTEHQPEAIGHPQSMQRQRSLPHSAPSPSRPGISSPASYVAMIFWNVSRACRLWRQSACAIYKARACTARKNSTSDEVPPRPRSSLLIVTHYISYGLYRAHPNQSLAGKEIRTPKPAPRSKTSGPRALSAANKQWVEATLRKMTDDEKIGQLLFTTYHGSFTATDAAAYTQDDARCRRSARRRIHQRHADVAAGHHQEPGLSDRGAHQSVAGPLKIAAADRRGFRTRLGHASR